MNKLQSRIIMLLMAILLIGLYSCSSDEDSQEEQHSTTSNEVKVYFVYTLDTSNGNSMTRAAKTNAEVFDEFYQMIKTGDLVAPSFELTLTEVNSGVVYTFKGKWNSHDLLTLRTGTYRVVGKSTAEGENIQEKCSFTFDEQIDISITSNVITLHANYDSSLLIFNNAEILSLQNFNGSALASFFTFSTYKYAFVNSTLYDVAKKNEAYILGKYTDDAEFKIFTGNLSFEKGKYYVYNSISNGFDVPPMDEGGEQNREIEGFGRVANAIDLGLSVKWASWNVGASKIADYGGLYGAGDPTGLNTSTSYRDYYFKNGESICGTEYDLAHVKWGGTWRLPTTSEIKELKERCTWERNITIDNVKGSKATGPNGNSIFIPYAGFRRGSTNNQKDDHASIWSGDMGVSLHSYGYMDMDICGDGSFQLDGCENYYGQSIRPVCE